VSHELGVRPGLLFGIPTQAKFRHVSCIVGPDYGKRGYSRLTVLAYPLVSITFPEGFCSKLRTPNPNYSLPGADGRRTHTFDHYYSTAVPGFVFVGACARMVNGGARAKPSYTTNVDRNIFHLSRHLLYLAPFVRVSVEIVSGCIRVELEGA
jgi:hypothetical protein